METEKQKPLPIKIVSNNFIPVPRFWVDALMGAQWMTPDKKKYPRIPSSFWKYSLFLWRWITNGNQERRYSLSLDRFPVRPASAVRWTSAYAVSGVFDVEMGKWSKTHDVSTDFKYRVAASELEWQCFIQALGFVLNTIKEETEKTRKSKYQKFSTESNTGAFKVLLALKVDELRNQQKLPPANIGFLADAASGRSNDTFGRPIARIENERIVPIFYSSVRLKRKGETDDDFEKRMQDEVRDADDAIYGKQAW